MTTCTNTSTVCSELKTRIDARQAKIGIIGLGYVGLPLALLYSEEHFKVTGFDIDQHKVATLNAGDLTSTEFHLQKSRPRAYMGLARPRLARE